MKRVSKLIAWLEKGEITTALDFERAMLMERQLKQLAKEDPRYNVQRKVLLTLLVAYEKQHFDPRNPCIKQNLNKHDRSEIQAEKEQKFLEERKSLIRKHLKERDLSQEELAIILGHKSRTHMSELINGIRPFSLPDLISISTLLKIDLIRLIPNFISEEQKALMRDRIHQLNKPMLQNPKFVF